jgi:hypothetical protein
MLFHLLFQPLTHGAAGYWDELVNLIPLIIGGVLLIYLYLTSKKRRAKEKDSPEKEIPHERD